MGDRESRDRVMRICDRGSAIGICDRAIWRVPQWGVGKEDGSVIPVACTLTPADFAARRSGLLPGLLQRAASLTPIPGGYRVVPGVEDRDIASLGRLIEAELHCCAF